MAIAFVKGFAGSDAFSESIVVTVPGGGIAAGNHLVIAASCQDGSFDVSSIADDSGNTYAVHTGTRQVSSGTAVLICSGVITTALAAGDDITLTLAGATGGSCCLGEFSGLATTSYFDQSAKAIVVFDTAFSSGATPTTTQADELVFGLNFANSASPSFTPGSGFTEIDDTAWFSSWRQQCQYKIVAATGAQTSTATASASVAGIAICATFKAAAAAAASFLPRRPFTAAHPLVR